MDKCPKCGRFLCSGRNVECLEVQLAAANERVGRLEAQMVELQKAWDILRHEDFVVNGGDRVNWSAHDEARANIDRILGGA